MVGGIENEGESMPQTRKSHPPSLKAKVRRRGHQGAQDGRPDRADIRRPPDPGRGLEEAGPGCPTIGTKSTLATAVVTIPSGHNGVVLFSGKTRLFADHSDSGGNVSLGFNLDGSDIGTITTQQLQPPSTESSRTMTASYLATGSHHLSVGNHTIKVWAQAQTGSSFVHLSATRDLPLIYLD